MPILKPDIVRQTVWQYGGGARGEPPENIMNKRSALIGHLDAALQQVDGDNKDITAQNRHIVTGWLFSELNHMLLPMSMKELTPGQLWGIDRWCGAKVDDRSGKWLPRQTFEAEARWVLVWAKFDKERQVLDPAITMRALLDFWAEHAYDLNNDPEMATTILELGGAAHI